MAVAVGASLGEGRFRALFDFEGRDGELSLRKGDVVIITDKADADWWTGEAPGGG
jgi:hypothetical protein